jgi:hypothetical protein
MKKTFKSGDITLKVRNYKTGVVEVSRGKELIFVGENPTMLLHIHTVLTKLAMELNKNEEELRKLDKKEKTIKK